MSGLARLALAWLRSMRRVWRDGERAAAASRAAHLRLLAGLDAFPAAAGLRVRDIYLGCLRRWVPQEEMETSSTEGA